MEMMKKFTKMNNIEFKNIINEWKNFLLYESNYNKILDIIEDIKILNKEYGTKIVISDNEKEITIRYSCPERQIMGEINLTNQRQSGTAIKSGEKVKSWEVEMTGKTTKGYGPLLYEIAIEYVNINYNSSLRPDSKLVSSDAKKVWDKYEKREDIDSMQLDIFAKTYYKGKGYKNLTPEPEDDTIQNSSIIFSKMSKGREKWHDISLSKTYKKKNNDNKILKILEENGLIRYIKY